MNNKRYVMAALATFVFIFLYEWLVHGMLLEGSYMATEQVWRPKGESNMLFIFGSQFLASFFIALIFTRNFEGKGVGEGVRFGLLMGLLFASLDLGWYCHLPIPFSLVASWMAANFLKGIGAGVVCALVYRK